MKESLAQNSLLAKELCLNVPAILLAVQMEKFGLIPGRARDFRLLHSVQFDFGAHLASYLEGTWGVSSGAKADGN
jgi:hypothetical protein